MATRSNILLKRKDGSFKSIYCHWDGYPQGVGQTLVEDYKDLDKVNKLLDLGDLSFIGREIGEKVDFNNHKIPTIKGEHAQCLAYGRDRGDNATGPRYWLSLERNFGVDYVYIFCEEEKRWTFFSTNRDQTQLDLKKWLYLDEMDFEEDKNLKGSEAQIFYQLVEYEDTWEILKEKIHAVKRLSFI